ncbi:N-acyl-D-glucosamine 2-epimerase [Paenibacillus larvae]|uniref:N-acyl-D-glucosamine 2-epimerase n=1 Tax=Paenibacillus larvae TaxID=1464 RepID=UPI0033F98A6C
MTTTPVSAVTHSAAERKQHALCGPSIQVDPGFPYYQGRTPASIAEEIRVNGYRSVHYFVTNENNVNRELIEAFHNAGLAVWALVLGNGSYSVTGFPEDWPAWQMKLLKERPNDGFYLFSPFSEKYVAWKKQALAHLIESFPFDGIEIAEPYFPEWNGIESGNYGDVGPLAEAAFSKFYGLPMPNFADPKHAYYYKKQPDLYGKWQTFRVDAVNNFLNELINGRGGVREARPGLLVATWSLAIDAGPGSVSLLREYQGMDAAKMISAVHPDIHVLQTHWPDWGKPESVLPGNYPLKYQPFVEQIRSRHPSLPLGIQADIGSGIQMTKSRTWLNTFIQTTQQIGYSTWTAYEYHLGGYIYEEVPIAKEAKWTDSHTIRVTFHKRIKEVSAKQPNSFVIGHQGKSFPVPPNQIRVDGNCVYLKTRQLLKGNIYLTIRNVQDTPELWLYHKDQMANTILPDTRIPVEPYSSGNTPLH